MDFIIVAGEGIVSIEIGSGTNPPAKSLGICRKKRESALRDYREGGAVLPRKMIWVGRITL